MLPTIERARVGSEQFDYDIRRYNDTVTWLAEVLPGSMRTPFEYTFDGRELYAEDGSALRKIFDDSIEQARYLPAYEQRRRRIEKEEYQDMLAMMRGDLPNTMVVISDFPPELMQATQDVGGYNTARKQTMLRVLVRTPQGTLKMYSQSLDGSNRQALEAVYAYFGRRPQPGELLGQRIHADAKEHEQDFLVDWLTGVYDRSLQVQYGGEWYAGMMKSRKLNTYDFVRQQQDLIKAYLATTTRFTGGKADYNLAAAMLARFENKAILQPIFLRNELSYHGPAVAAHAMALAEMNGAGMIARGNGVVLSGCGMTISAEGGSAGKDGAAQLEDAGYGNKADKLPDDKYGPRTFRCPKKGCLNTRPKDTLIPKCQKCGADVRCK